MFNFEYDAAQAASFIDAGSITYVIYWYSEDWTDQWGGADTTTGQSTTLYPADRYNEKTFHQSF